MSKRPNATQPPKRRIRPQDSVHRRCHTIVILVYVRRGLRIGVVLSLGFGDFSGMSAKALSDSAPIFFVYSV